MPPKTEAQWSLDQETALLRALCSHRPLGTQKHFQVVCLWNELCTNGLSAGLKVTDIWTKLAHFYNLAKLEDGESSDEADEADNPVEFELPWEDYGHLIVKQGLCNRSSSQATSPAQLSASQRGVKRGRSSSVVDNKELMPSPAPTQLKGKPGRKKKFEKETKQSHTGFKATVVDESPRMEADNNAIMSSMPSTKMAKKKPGRPKVRDISADKPKRKSRRTK